MTLVNYLKGREPKACFLERVSEKCGVTTDWLIKGEEMPVWRMRPEPPGAVPPNAELHELLDRAIEGHGEIAAARVQGFLEAIAGRAAPTTSPPAAEPYRTPRIGSPEERDPATVHRLVDELLHRRVGAPRLLEVLERILHHEERQAAAAKRPLTQPAVSAPQAPAEAPAPRPEDHPRPDE